MKKTMPCLIAALLTITSQNALAKPIKVTFWTIASLIDIEKTLADRFNKLHNGKMTVSVVLEPDEDKILTAMAGGAAPDCFLFDRFKVGTWASKNVLMPLDSFIKRDKVDPNWFYKATWAEATYGGKVYCLPRNTETRALWYNKDLFSKAGLSPNNPPKTWNELLNASKKLDRPDAKGDWSQAGFLPLAGNWYFCGWLWAAGGELVDNTNKKVAWNSSEGLKAMGFITSLLNKYGGRSKVSSWSNNEFYSGKLASMVDVSSFLLTAYKKANPKFELGIASVPRPDGLEGDPITWCGGRSYAIPRGAKHAQQAWEFIKFMATEKDSQLEYAVKGGIMSALKSAATSDKFLSSHPMMPRFVSLLPYARFRPVVPGSGDLYATYTTEMHSLINKGLKSPKEILDTTAAEGQKILDRAWSRVRN